MENIGMAELRGALVTAAALCALLAALWKGIEALRQLTGTDRRAEEKKEIAGRLDRLDARLTACEEGLRRDEKRQEDARSDMTQALNVLNALLMHFISGNDHEKLRSVKEGLDSYLSGR